MTDARDRQDDFDRGLANRRAVLGDEWVDKSLDNANEFNADFQQLITRYAWHEIWGRPGLDHTTRRLLTMAMTMGMGRWEEFALHCTAAVRSEVPLGLIKETLMQGAIYCGVPAANTGFKLMMDALRAEGRLPAPQPLTTSVRAAVHRTFSQPQLAVSLQGPGQGGKAPVVLSHALGLDLHMWDALAAELAADGHPVLRYDHRGHGDSAAPPGPYSMDDLVDDAARLVREWGRGPVVWIGLSMGGMVGQGLAVRHPDLVRALVIANSSARYPAAAKTMWAERIARVESGGMAVVADTVIERYFSPAYRAAEPAATAAWREQLLGNDPAGYAAACHAVAGVDWLDALKTVTSPTLVIAGALDAGAPVAMSEAMVGQIAGARLVVIADASHLSPIEQPARFAQEIKGFLVQIADR
jgi:3-oxoadipate enol-lactonase